jgi:hypothetical protein
MDGKMSEEIICECGHKAYEHNRFAGYNCHWKKFNVNCECHLSKETVEARYWARRMMKEKEVYKNAWSKLFWKYNDCLSERDTLRAELKKTRELSIEMWTIDEFVKYKKQLEVAKKALRNIISKPLYAYGDNEAATDMVYTANNALAEIEKIERECENVE